ncbi:MAG: GIY-YIG nuclease family protein [Pseudomonadota bacterium]
MVRLPAVYIMANKNRGTLYTGVTSNLPGRVWQHKNRITRGFATRYKLHLLVYFETADTMRAAIEREQQIKSGSRRRKIRLIENMNPDWRDLYRFVSD